MVDFLLETVQDGVQDGDSMDDVGERIVEYVKDMAQVSPDTGGASSSSSYLGSNLNHGTFRIPAATSISTQEAFSPIATSRDDVDETNVIPHK